MDLDKLIRSKESQEAQRRISSWKERLEKAGPAEAMKVRDEKAAFFKAMRKSSPDLYIVFLMDDKTLSERIYERLTGKKVTID